MAHLHVRWMLDDALLRLQGCSDEDPKKQERLVEGVKSRLRDVHDQACAGACVHDRGHTCVCECVCVCVWIFVWGGVQRSSKVGLGGEQAEGRV